MGGCIRGEKKRCRKHAWADIVTMIISIPFLAGVIFGIFGLLGSIFTRQGLKADADELAAQAHACYYVAELAVAVCALIQVHEVHVDCVPWNFLVELRMQVE